MPNKEDLLKSFINNLKNKKFDNDWELDFWLTIAPFLDEQALEKMNHNLISEEIDKLKNRG